MVSPHFTTWFASTRQNPSSPETPAAKALATLEANSIVHEITGQQYRKLYAYREYLDVLNEDAI